MPDIHIQRDHALGLAHARKLAFQWAETAEARFDLTCTYEEGKTSDLLSFTRSGISGELRVTQDSFELDARLGFLLGAFKERIEREIAQNLDDLLGSKVHGASGSAVAVKARPAGPAVRKAAARRRS